jgi:hypothetical protein
MIRCKLFYRWSIAIGLLTLTSVLHGNQPDENVEEQLPDVPLSSLEVPILAPQTTLLETRAVVQARVPRMPAIDSVARWKQLEQTWREDVLGKVVLRGEAKNWADALTRIEWLGAIEGGPGYRILKFRYDALPGFWIPGLLYEPSDLARSLGQVLETPPASITSDLRPVVLNVNGHDPTGKAAEYKQLRCIHLAKQGAIAMNIEWIGMGQLATPDNSHAAMNQIDLCGASGLAPFYLSMKRALDILLGHPHADPQRVAVAGLSGGGWQTILISSLDTRVTLANPVAGYSSFLTRNENLKDLGDSEQTPSDLATVVDYTHLTAMLAPRAALLTYNTKDNCCFESGYALPPLLQAAEPVYRLLGQPGRLRVHEDSDPGDHNFGLSNRQALYRVVGEEFFAGVSGYSANEVDAQSELKSSEQLMVELPTDNLSLNGIARRLAARLPRDHRLPQSVQRLPDWQAERRSLLRELVRWQDFTVSAETRNIQGPEDAQLAGINIRRIRVRFGGIWTAPLVEFAPQNPRSTILLVGEGPRSDWQQRIQSELSRGNRVVILEPFYFGECRFESHDYLQGLLLATVGLRPIGIQASQISGAAGWLNDRYGQPVTLVAQGQRASQMALIAAAVDSRSIGELQLHQCLPTLRGVVEENRLVTVSPELFCFGLLEHFDQAQLAALVAPRPLSLIGLDPRKVGEHEALTALYQQLLPGHELFQRQQH